MRKSSLAGAALVAAVFVSPSHAGAFDKAPQMTVVYSDLDIARPAGANTLLTRLNMAARIVCGYGAVDIRLIASVMEYRKCYNTAMDGAVRQVGNQLVAEIYGKPMLIAGQENTVVTGDVRPARDVVLSSR